MINIIIFSKNRSCQLNLLLDSLKIFTDIKNPFVLYTTTHAGFEAGYKKIKGCQLIKQLNFKEDLTTLINKNKPYTMFLVDDDVFNRYFHIQEELKKFTDDMLCISPRLGKNIRYCYSADQPMTVPEIDEDGKFEWNKIKDNYDWQYPMSLDGNIFKTDDILPLLYGLNYRSPNTLEGQLAGNPINKKYVICYEQSKLVNVAVNRVQNDCNNRYGNISAEVMNEKFLDGYKIDIGCIIGKTFNSPHVVIDLDFYRE